MDLNTLPGNYDYCILKCYRQNLVLKKKMLCYQAAVVIFPTKCVSVGKTEDAECCCLMTPASIFFPPDSKFSAV